MPCYQGAFVAIAFAGAKVALLYRNKTCFVIISGIRPSHNSFRIAISSNNQKDPVQLLVTDMLGRVIETRNSKAGQILSIGDNYRNGTYVVKIIHGKEMRQVKLVKISE